MPIRQASVMTGNEIGQYPAMQPKLDYCVLCPSGRVVNSPRLAFEMGFGVIPGDGLDTPLKLGTVLPQVVP